MVPLVDICKERVRYRFEVESGHHVNEYTIDERFVKGLENLNNAILKFTRIFLFNTGKYYDMSPLFAVEDGQIVSFDHPLPTSITSLIPKINALLNHYSYGDDH